MRAPARQDIEVRLRQIIDTVIDPDLGFSLGEMGMVDEITVDRHGDIKVALQVPSTALGEPERLHGLIETAIARNYSVAGGFRPQDIKIVTGPMNDQGRMNVAQKLKTVSGPASLGSQTRVYAVASGKGGVGKSVITANLAAALAQAGQRVGVIDADVWGYSTPQLFGVHAAPAAIKGVMLPVPAHGVRIMSVGFFVADTEPVVWRGPMLHKALEQFVNDVYWGELDVLLLDLPPGTGDVAMSLIEFLPNLAMLLVTTPQEAVGAVARRAAAMALDSRVPVLGVIENMAEVVCHNCGTHTPVFGQGAGQKLATDLKIPLLGQVPIDPLLLQAADAGKPVVLSHPQAPAAAELSRIANSLPKVDQTIAHRPLPLFVVDASG